MSTVKKCDFCQKVGSPIGIKWKVKAGRWYHSFAGSIYERYDVCDDCVEKLRKKVEKNLSRL